LIACSLCCQFWLTRQRATLAPYTFSILGSMFSASESRFCSMISARLIVFPSWSYSSSITSICLEYISLISC
jgi:hypothetical protein